MQDLINMFNDHELELLISGLPEIDVADLRANTEYTGYTPAAKQVQWFWELVSELSKEDLALLVQFVTGTSKVPLEGFKALQVSIMGYFAESTSAPANSTWACKSRFDWEGLHCICFLAQAKQANVRVTGCAPA